MEKNYRKLSQKVEINNKVKAHTCIKTKLKGVEARASRNPVEAKYLVDPR